MCGIAGVFGRADHETVRAMLAALSHRGPDDEHVIVTAHAALGARRLAIVDVAGGRQPVANERGTVWAVQNGELYNFPELRPRLLARGHRLLTHCDTEILPHLYEDHGVRLPEEIDGMFAVAVWDETGRLGLLARDRMGKKPLYYLRDGDALYFASEIKALLRAPGFERRIDLEALHHFLSYKHVPHPLSIFRGISILPPAHRLVFRPGVAPAIERYWDLRFDGADGMGGATEDDLVEQLAALLRRGVERRLMADVPVGFFLSGGIDSSLTTALAAEVAPGPIKTFTLTYEDEATTPGKEQDRRWARWVAERYGTEHHEESISFESFPESLRLILKCFDEPFAGVASTYFLAKRMSQHVKVAIAGDGADELFGSYLSHRLAFPVSRYGEYVRTGDTSLIRPFENQPALVSRLAGREDWDWRHDLSVLTDEEKAQLYAPDVAPLMAGFSTRDHLRRHFAALTAADPLNRILEAEWRTIFPDQVLTFVDRLSMAHSLEVRSAFLDTDVVTFVAALPGRLKIAGGETKHLLKRVASRYFPGEMVHRRKEGFVMPVAHWLAHDLEPYVRDTLCSERLSKHGLFDTARVGRMVDRLYREEHDHTYVNKVLSLIVFQEWYELYMM